jgi:sugar porter (SP) family MFS transporter
MSKWLWVAFIVVLFAGALFGYDQGVISGALPGIEATFHPSLLMIQVVTSWVTLGALIGSLAGGEMADHLGRKYTVVLAGALFAIGAGTQFAALNTLMLVTGRFVIGAGVGIAAVSAPLYAAELAPAAIRGRFVSGYQLAITGGIFLAYLINGQLESSQWRLMLGAAAVPGIALVIIGLITNESPRWLVKHHRDAEARATIVRLEPGIDVDGRMKLVEASLSEDLATGTRRSSTYGHLASMQWRRPLVIAIGLAVFQQITGINAIIYYANQIFAAAGFATEAARASVTLWAIGGVNVLATFIAIVFIDRVGRRLLLLAGLIGMGSSLVVVGFAFRFIHLAGATAADSSAATAPSVAGIVTVIALVVFIISFAFSLGPVTWTVINEVFPSHIRSRGVALATAVNWGSAWLVSQFFLSLVDLLGSSLTFWLFAVFCVLGFIWVYRIVPETKGKTLEQIQSMWATA